MFSQRIKYEHTHILSMDFQHIDCWLLARCIANDIKNMIHWMKSSSFSWVAIFQMKMIGMPTWMVNNNNNKNTGKHVVHSVHGYETLVMNAMPSIHDVTMKVKRLRQNYGEIFLRFSSTFCHMVMEFMHFDHSSYVYKHNFLFELWEEFLYKTKKCIVKTGTRFVSRTHLNIVT